MRGGVDTESKAADNTKVRHPLGKLAYDSVAHQKAVLRNAARSDNRQSAAGKRLGATSDINRGGIIRTLPKQGRITFVRRGHDLDAVFTRVFQFALGDGKSFLSCDTTGYIAPQAEIRQYGFGCGKNRFGGTETVEQAGSSSRSESSDKRKGRHCTVFPPHSYYKS